jgi:phospholipid/cholesterol/gamma-HCH transport system ATP-binding protein
MVTATDIPSQQPKLEAEDRASAVAVENVHKSFGVNKVLNGISLHVGRGETLAVLGRSGTGKSVLLRLIIGLSQPDSGSVSVFGEDLAGLSIDKLSAIRKKMGFLFQHAALYDSLTVAENVAFPLQHHRSEMSKSERRQRAAELLAEVGMDGSLDKMPSDISGGMQKRVGLARALALDPEILLLDEPTAGLDPISSREIDNLILVTHDLLSAKIIASRLALLDKGNVVIEGNFEDLEHSDIAFVQQFLKQS